MSIYCVVDRRRTFKKYSSRYQRVRCDYNCTCYVLSYRMSWARRRKDEFQVQGILIGFRDWTGFGVVVWKRKITYRSTALSREFRLTVY